MYTRSVMTNIAVAEPKGAPMAERMHRTQILLEPAQHAWLAEVAQSEKRSISDLIREMMDSHIHGTERQTETAKVRRLAALDRIF